MYRECSTGSGASSCMSGRCGADPCKERACRRVAGQSREHRASIGLADLLGDDGWATVNTPSMRSPPPSSSSARYPLRSSYTPIYPQSLRRIHRHGAAVCAAAAAYAEPSRLVTAQLPYTKDIRAPCQWPPTTQPRATHPAPLCRVERLRAPAALAHPPR